MLEFGSSKPQLMEVRREKQGFDANESKNVDIYIAPQLKACQEEVFLYVNDESGRISESILFQVIVSG
jgi:hypothetical protein